MMEHPVPVFHATSIPIDGSSKLHAPIHHHVLELDIPQLADKQVRVEPTDNWEQLKMLCRWLE